MNARNAGERSKPFLTLTTTSVNGWFMAMCPEFEVSACGFDHATVVVDLHDMVRRNATLYIQEEDKLPPGSQLLKWSKVIIDQKDADISDLFKTTFQK